MHTSLTTLLRLLPTPKTPSPPKKTIFQDLRSISLQVATAVALAALEGGLAQKQGLPQDKEGMEALVAAAMWSPEAAEGGN
jgi:malic enzyme